MSVKCVAYVFHESPAVGNDRLVLLAIADEADNDGLNAFPSVDLLAHKARVNGRTVRRCLARLEAAGELLIRRPDHPGRGRHNRYVLTMGRPPTALAGSIGWPPPKLDPTVAAEWAQAEGGHSDPLVEDPQPGHKPVDGGDEKGRIPDTTDRKAGAQVSPDPKTLNDTVRARARRRGLDPLPDDERVTASLQRAAAGAEQARATAALPRLDTNVVDHALADARARLGALHTAAAAAGVDLHAAGPAHTISLHTPNELDDHPPEDDPELDEHDPRPDDEP